MNLQQLYYFTAIVEKKSYTNAAKTLYISQSSLSHSISALEKELGVTLFEKAGHAISLTASGEVFFLHASTIIRELDCLWADIQRQKELSNEVITVWNGPFDGINTITKYGSELIRKFKGRPENKSIAFKVYEKPGATTATALLQDRVDFGFNVYSRNDQLSYLPLVQEELVVITPSNHRLSRRKNIHLKEIEGFPLIIYPHEYATRKILEDYFEQAEVKPTVVAEIINDRLIASMVSANQGIGIIPFLPNVIECYDIEVIHVAEPKMSRTQAVFWRTDKKHSAAVSRFIQFAESFSNSIEIDPPE